MGLIQTQHNLTVLDSGFEQTRRSTYPGMAHFAGSGPVGKVCRECALWTGCGAQSGYYAKSGKFGGMLKPRPCAKHKEMMAGEVGPGVPHDARACKYFSQNETPPTLTQK
jgi:hypothetical protein